MYEEERAKIKPEYFRGICANNYHSSIFSTGVTIMLTKITKILDYIFFFFASIVTLIARNSRDKCENCERSGSR